MMRHPGKQQPQQAPGQNEHDRALREAISLGVEAKRFLDGKLAYFICNEAERKVIDAQNQLSVIDPTNWKEIARLQGVVQQFSHFTGCLQDMVTAGDSAYQLYLEQHKTD